MFDGNVQCALDTSVAAGMPLDVLGKQLAAVD